MGGLWPIESTVPHLKGFLLVLCICLLVSFATAWAENVPWGAVLKRTRELQLFRL